MATQARRRRGAGEWQTLLARFAGSGQDLDTFCQAEGVSPASFYRWRRLLGDTIATEPASPSFLDLGPLRPTRSGATDSKPSHPLELTLDLGDGLVVHLRRG